MFLKEPGEGFDKLIMLTSQPGRVVYNGPTGKAIAHYAAVGHPVPLSYLEEATNRGCPQPAQQKVPSSAAPFFSTEIWLRTEAPGVSVPSFLKM